MGAPAKGVVLERADLAAWGRAMRDANRTVAFTNGCFDLIHSGHLASLADLVEDGCLWPVGAFGLALFADSQRNGAGLRT